MKKKVLIIFVFLFGLMFFMYYTVNKEIGKETTPEEEEVSDQKLIGNSENIALYVTDYRYDTAINGYNYVEVELNNPEELKKSIAELNLYDKVDDVVYGKYKLVLDDKTIFFDLDSDSGLWMEENITFNFPAIIKKKYLLSTDTCSCCDHNPDCKVKLCSCDIFN